MSPVATVSTHSEGESEPASSAVTGIYMIFGSIGSVPAVTAPAAEKTTHTAITARTDSAVIPSAVTAITSPAVPESGVTAILSVKTSAAVAENPSTALSCGIRSPISTIADQSAHTSESEQTVNGFKNRAKRGDQVLRSVMDHVTGLNL